MPKSRNVRPRTIGSPPLAALFMCPKSKPKCVFRVGLLMGRPNATRRRRSGGRVGVHRQKSHVLLHAGRHRYHLPAYQPTTARSISEPSGERYATPSLLVQQLKAAWSTTRPEHRKKKPRAKGLNGYELSCVPGSQPTYGKPDRRSLPHNSLHTQRRMERNVASSHEPAKHATNDCVVRPRRRLV